MAIAPDKLYCANTNCLEVNPGSAQTCRRCGSKLIRRYLWVTGERNHRFQPGEWVGNDRYFVIAEQIVLDTQPGIVPAFPKQLSEIMVPYLHLFPHRLVVPQIYGTLTSSSQQIFLLEEAPIYTHDVILRGKSAIQSAQNLGEHVMGPGNLMPTLWDALPYASPYRQINWLWQVVRLWQPLQEEGVAWSLLNSNLLRVDGSIVRLLELELHERPATLEDLGQLLAQWASQAHSSIQPLLNILSEKLQGGELRTSSRLLAVMEQVLEKAGQTQIYDIQITGKTDKGPNRNNNEDICFPSDSEVLHTTSGLDSLSIVCDGLGGHDGGEIAATMAVEAIRAELSTGFNHPQIFPDEVLRRAITEANDRISRKNNQEHRQERRRMGTTLVTALTIKHLIYLAHVGDSRAYWITPASCRQLTLDDDLASRQVRLGFGLYRAALQNPSSGALIQALGMSSSHNLNPTIQHFFLDDEMILMLCSDGLSDHDLIERLWHQEVVSTSHLTHNLADTVNRLIDLANQHNGHDNVTVSLLHYRARADRMPDPEELVSVVDNALVSFAQSSSSLPGNPDSGTIPQLNSPDLTDSDTTVPLSAPLTTTRVHVAPLKPSQISLPLEDISTFNYPQAVKITLLISATILGVGVGLWAWFFWGNPPSNLPAQPDLLETN